MSSAANNRLEDKVAVVTGASRGIGASIARALGQQGAQVVLAARKAEGLEQVARDIEGSGGRALPVPCHMGKTEEVDSLVRRSVEHFGKIDVLVNNAATNPYFGPLMNVEWAAWDKTFEVNLKGYFTATRAVVRHLQQRDAPGSIVNVASIVGTIGAPLQGVYAMTKAAVISMTRTLALELGSAGVRVNALAPGLIETRFSRALVDDDAIREGILQRCGIHRVGQPEEVAGAAVFLASDDSSYMTGHVMVIDGGWTAS